MSLRSGQLSPAARRLDDVGDADAAAALSAQGFGTLGADHAWLDTEARARQAATVPEWQTGFAAMLHYAQRQGWPDEVGPACGRTSSAHDGMEISAGLSPPVRRRLVP
ncbi:hypothetical protein [uncultured Jatrophihabitans sp.]|uniref:hypothetical protein n=1 Tax=uncultured Jatrophihabitans sp. TaxID=1610747 RepID=UPI0035CBB54D